MQSFIIISLAAVALAAPDVARNSFNRAAKYQQKYGNDGKIYTNVAFRCGSSWEDANGKCGDPCPSGKDYQCGYGERCFADLQTTCGHKKHEDDHHEWTDGDGKIYTDVPYRCGYSWEDANSKCGTSCASGKDYECQNGEHCFADLHTSCGNSYAMKKSAYKKHQNEEKTYTSVPYRCGSSWEDANAKCGAACPSGKDYQCGYGEHCYADLQTTCDENNGGYNQWTDGDGKIYTDIPYRCGKSWDDANSKCGAACPSGKDYQCGYGEHCYADLQTYCQY